MFLIFNWPGLIMLIISLVISLSILGINTQGKDASFSLIIGISFIVLDLVTRIITKKRGLESKIKGGTLFFIPVFVIGIILILLSIFYF